MLRRRHGLLLVAKFISRIDALEIRRYIPSLVRCLVIFSNLDCNSLASERGSLGRVPGSFEIQGCCIIFLISRSLFECRVQLVLDSLSGVLNWWHSYYIMFLTCRHNVHHGGSKLLGILELIELLFLITASKCVQNLGLKHFLLQLAGVSLSG